MNCASHMSISISRSGVGALSALTCFGQDGFFTEMCSVGRRPWGQHDKQRGVDARLHLKDDRHVGVGDVDAGHRFGVFLQHYRVI